MATLEGSRKKRKVQEEEAVHETTVSVHEEKKQKKMSESQEIIDPESEKNAIFSQKASQNSHKETVDEKKKHFKCECGKQFSTNYIFDQIKAQKLTNFSHKISPY